MCISKKNLDGIRYGLQLSRKLETHDLSSLSCSLMLAVEVHGSGEIKKKWKKKREDWPRLHRHRKRTDQCHHRSRPIRTVYPWRPCCCCFLLTCLHAVWSNEEKEQNSMWSDCLFTIWGYVEVHVRIVRLELELDSIVCLALISIALFLIKSNGKEEWLHSCPTWIELWTTLAIDGREEHWWGYVCAYEWNICLRIRLSVRRRYK